MVDDRPEEHDPLDARYTEWRYTPLELMRASPGVARAELDVWDASPSWFGKQPQDVAADDFRRFQYDKLLFYPVEGGARRSTETKIAPVEFRTFVYWVGEVPDSLELHIEDTVNPHLRTLFNTGPYDGWMDGYDFVRETSNREASSRTPVAADEASNLGVVQWEVLVLDTDQDVRGSAYGFADPWALVEYAPDHEVWNVTRNDARESYEIRPQGRARARLLGTRKATYVNGHYVGNTVPTRGTIWVSFEYDTKDGTWKDSHTGDQMWSRQKLIQDGGMHPQEMRDEGKIYKVGETTDSIFLVTSRTSAEETHGFDPTTPAEIPPEVADSASELQMSDATDFSIRRDSGPQLGKYDTPTQRRITERTSWSHQTRPK